MNKHEIAIRTKTIRDLLEDPRMKKQLEMAIPRHLTVDRLLRTVVTALRTNPTLLDCTKESILASVMGACQLGLEPEPFLGQAYLVPFKRKGVLEATLIPGYRGYIALARRSGEVQSVSAQVVYSKDHFVLQYGTDEKLEHIPSDGDRGSPKGAYVVFKYKDGSYSFDYMTNDDIDKIRDRSKAKDDGPWVTDWPEMAKKTVIRRHAKLAPLAVEIQRAAAMEDRAYAGESQFEMVFPEQDERPGLPEGRDFFKALNEYLTDRGIMEYDGDKLGEFLKLTAEAQEMTVDEIKQAALHNLSGFWEQFKRWSAGQGENEEPKDSLPFAKLKKPGLMSWEAMNRNQLPNMDKELQEAFMEKWERVVGVEYGQWLANNTELESEPKTEEKPEVELDCPNTGEKMKISYCEKYCKTQAGCPAYEEYTKQPAL